MSRDPRLPLTYHAEPSGVALGYDVRVAGNGDLQSQIARLIGQALREAKDADLHRPEIAGRMAAQLGYPFSAATLDKWAAESETARLPRVDHLAAFIAATEAFDLLAFLPNLFGFVVIPAHYVEAIELQELEEREREIQERKRVLQAKRKARQ